MHLRKMALTGEQDSDCKHVYFINSGQHATKSAKHTPDSRTLDNTLVGYLEFKGIATH